jgi:translation initiation factor 2B subunit (eIF-2B alpha/beta/delta family)
LLAAGRVDVVLVGADAVAVDGSLLNAAGTYPMALAAARAGVPFYACFPRTQLDPRAASGADFRPRTRPSAAGAEIPVQDVTPPDLVTGWLTEAGLERPPFGLHRRAEAA